MSLPAAPSAAPRGGHPGQEGEAAVALRRIWGDVAFLRRLYRMERAFARRSFAPRLWMRGFFSQRAALYPFDRHDSRWFLNDWEIERRLGRVNDEASIPLLGNKLLFHLLLARSPLADAAAPLVGLVADGAFRPLGPFATAGEALAALGRLVRKPVNGWGGAGVSVVESEEAALAEGGGGGLFLIEGFLRQHDYAARIFPGSLNTIRIVTMIGPDGAPFVAAAAHRFGSAASAPVDNFKQGGVSALVDLETGALSPGRSHPGVHAVHVHEAHPETDAPIAGVRVPMWAEAQALALRLAGLCPGLRHVGWDICVTPEGPRVVEGNGHLANPNLIQAHRPLLLDPRVRDFLRRHGVLSARRARRLEA
jgi:Sugar-transfer associated ATP-grasp